jgi:hypothetical protein
VGEDGRLFVVVAKPMKHKPCRWHLAANRMAQPRIIYLLRTVFSLYSAEYHFQQGYSAEYGEALSSVLLLNTQDEPDQNKTEISLMTVGWELEILKNGKSSLSVNANYINLVVSSRNSSKRRLNPFNLCQGNAIISTMEF